MTPDQSPLGKTTDYVDQYDPSLLFPLPREAKRVEIGITGSVPFLGADLWTAFELSWLNMKGKPQVAIAHITIPCESTHIVESKSFKLYLNSFNNTRLDSADAVRDRIRDDISRAIWGGEAVKSSAGVRLLLPELFECEPVKELEGVSIDRLDVECDTYQPTPAFLSAALDEKPVDEVLVSDLLRSNCPVTGQPDWATVVIHYRGPRIDRVELLRYLVSFRDHAEFHEQCVERIFHDVMAHCRPASLSVEARYTRRGGLDINPWRATADMSVPPMKRDVRQ